MRNRRPQADFRRHLGAEHQGRLCYQIRPLRPLQLVHKAAGVSPALPGARISLGPWLSAPPGTPLRSGISHRRVIHHRPGTPTGQLSGMLRSHSCLLSDSGASLLDRFPPLSAAMSPWNPLHPCEGGWGVHNLPVTRGERLTQKPSATSRSAWGKCIPDCGEPCLTWLQPHEPGSEHSPEENSLDTDSHHRTAQGHLTTKKASTGGLLRVYLKCMQSPFFSGATCAENTWWEGPALQAWPHLPPGTLVLSPAEHGGETWATSDSALCIGFS
uniref:Uncharacterized protein n=1 Tax=Rangifer tarandus platyrhynchus TaxID=3082113 RepID=A0ACB0F122_RANTA|nr:unnamed protein product [Rangifer tarandus platyrhynchus]